MIHRVRRRVVIDCALHGDAEYRRPRRDTLFAANFKEIVGPHKSCEHKCLHYDNR